MNKRKYSIGMDFGTESGRAVLVDVTNGREVAERREGFKVLVECSLLKPPKV
jgi:ribulose kinase